jgi:hypothetical protein
MPEFEIGTTEGGMTDVELLTTPVPAPKSSYQPYARVYNTGNGGTRGVGSPIATWTFPLLSVDQYNQLKSFCPGSSANVYIRTKLDDDSYADFQAKMIWPNDPLDRWYGERRNLTILFRHLILIPEGS